ncbi:MAG: zinc ribbon domain-containing protein [Candidatus Heimdallarchaeota archaeon]|nr:zinc ribbon domain-containing protein [Candidatus Heimdallarchaeota archaeon]MCK4290622.1 zinc ribbon domain-containing protein [Candidatus Heimdallarchaeota archaeon]
MSTGEKITCQSCGESVPKGRFCPKCGVILGASELDEVTDLLNRLQEIKTLVYDLRVKSLDTISIESEKVLLNFREEFQSLLKQVEIKEEILSEKQPVKDTKEQKPDSNRIICRNCGVNVPNIRFCKECGLQLHASPLTEIDEILNRVDRLGQIFGHFQNLTKTEFSDDLMEIIATIAASLLQIKNRFIAKRNILAKTMDIRPTPAVGVQPIPTSVAIKPSRVEEELVEKPKTMWSQLEKSLLNYWFFYLAIILFSVGITVTIYFVAVEVSNLSTRVIIIYSIGGGIVLLGEIASLLTKWQRRRQKHKIAEVDYESGDAIEKEGITKPEGRKLPIPQLASVIIFIGFVVLFTGGFFGYADINPTIFLFLSYGVAIISIVLGVLNNSEMLIFIGFNASIIFTAADILWHTQIVLGGGIGSLFGFIIPIVLASLVAIFFKKWWGALISMSVTPLLISIPRISQNVALEFIPLLLIPIMILLVIRFSKQSIEIINRRILAFLSLIFPAIALVILSIPLVHSGTTEASWGQIYPWEIFISCLAFLGVSFYYRFIQEKHLEFKQSNFAIWIIGQIIVGIISVFSIGFNYGSGSPIEYSVTAVLYFASFFVFGILSVLKTFKNHFNIATAVISFVFAELQAILLLSLINPGSTIEQVLYFIVAISFTIMAFVSIFITKVLTDSNTLFVTWNILSAINIILLGLLGKLPNNWYGFAGIILLLLTSLVVNLPIIIPQIKNWRVYSLITNLVTTVVIFSFLLGDKLAVFPYAALVIFLVFIVLNISPFINWKQKEVTTLE